jgi:acyl carrier protein phosphodiesterase
MKNQEVSGGGQSDGDLWGNLGAGGYSALDEVLMGLPSFLVKNIAGKDTWNKLDQFRKDHKLASDIGGGAGFIGSMLIPAGGIAKLAGKGAGLLKLGKLASKLDKASDIAKLSTKGLKGMAALKTGAKAGIVQALEQAIPRAITGLEGVNPLSGYTGEDLGKSAIKGVQNIGTSALFGGGTGATFGRLFNKAAPHVQSKLDDIGEAADKMVLQQIGATTKGMNKFYGGSGKGFQAKKVLGGFDEMAKEAADIVRKNGLKYEANQQPFIDKIDDVWESISANYNKLGQPPTIQEVAATPRMADLLDTFAGEEEKVSKIAEQYINKVSKLPTAGQQRKFLGSVYEKVGSNLDPDSTMRGQVALAIKDAIKDKINATTDAAPELVKEANRLFPMEQMLTEAMAKNKTKMNAGIKGGSDTFGKLFGQSLAGAGTGFIASGGDPADQDYAKKKLVSSLIGGAGGLLGGGILNKLGTSAAGNVLEKVANTLGNKLPIAKVVSEAVPGLAGKLSGAIPDKLSDGSPEGQSGGGGTPEQEKTEVAQLEAAATEPEKAQAKAEFTDAYKNTILTQLQNTYDTYYAKNPEFSGMTFDDFSQRVKKMTDGFDPLKSSKLLFPDNPEAESAYLEKYKTMLYLKNLDAEKSLSKTPGFMGILPGEYADEENYQKVRDLMINIASGGKIENMDSASMQKMVDEDLQRVMKSKGVKKSALLDMLTNKYGLDFSDLGGLGLV